MISLAAAQIYLLGCSKSYLANTLKIETAATETNEDMVGSIDSCDRLISQEKIDAVLKNNKIERIAYISGSDPKDCRDNNGIDRNAFYSLVVTPSFRQESGTLLNITESESKYAFEINLKHAEIFERDLEDLASQFGLENRSLRIRVESPVWKALFLNRLPDMLESQSEEITSKGDKITVLFSNIEHQYLRNKIGPQIKNLNVGKGKLLLIGFPNKNSKDLISFEIKNNFALTSHNVGQTSIEFVVSEIWERLRINTNNFDDDSLVFRLAIKNTISMEKLISHTKPEELSIFQQFAEYSNRSLSEYKRAIDAITRKNPNGKKSLKHLREKKFKLRLEILELVEKFYPNHEVAILAKRLRSIRPFFKDDEAAIESILTFFSQLNIDSQGSEARNNHQGLFEKTIKVADELNEYIKIGDYEYPNDSTFLIASQIDLDLDAAYLNQIIRFHKWLIKVGYNPKLPLHISEWRNGASLDSPRTARDLKLTLDLLEEVYETAMQAPIFRVSRNSTKNSLAETEIGVSRETELEKLFYTVFQTDSNFEDFNIFKKSINTIINDDFPKGPCETVRDFYINYTESLIENGSHKGAKFISVYDLNSFYIYTLIYRYLRLNGKYPADAHGVALQYILTRPLNEYQKGKLLDSEDVTNLNSIKKINEFLSSFLGQDYIGFVDMR